MQAIIELYFTPSSNRPIAISFDYRKMKNVEGLIKHLPRNPDLGAYFYLEELKIILVKCKRTTLAKFDMDAL